MDPEQMAEFEAVRDAAYEGLRRGTFIERSGRELICQFLILPAFENAVSWDIIRTANRRTGGEIRAFRSCWRMDVDAAAMASPVERLRHPRPYLPTVETGSVLLVEAEVEAILADFGATPVPLGVNRPIVGCDGSTFELAIGKFTCGAKIHWWDDLPSEWQALRPIIGALEQMLDRAWANATAVG